MELPKSQNYTTEAAMQWLVGIIKRAYELSGQTTHTPKDIADLAINLGAELTNKYAYLQPFEVKFAVEEGSKGYYGDYQGINMRSMVAFVRGYLQSSDRARYLKKVEEEYYQAQGNKQITAQSVVVEDPITKSKSLLNSDYGLFLRGDIQEWYWPFITRCLQQCGIAVPDARIYFNECKGRGMTVIFS